MSYTISEIAKMLNVAPSAIRYYDKEALLPSVSRTSGGIRNFSESDLQWMKMISCLKSAGMPIRDIQRYVECMQQGDSTLDERLEMFRAQKRRLLEKMQELQDTLDVVEFKCWYYETAKEAGTESVLKDTPVPEKFRLVVERLHRKE